MFVREGDEFHVICIQQAVCRLVVRQVIDVDDKLYRAYGRAVRDTN